MLFDAHYAPNYASIIGLSLVRMDTVIELYKFIDKESIATSQSLYLTILQYICI